MNKLKTGERRRFNVLDDLLLLREVVATNPYAEESRWKEIQIAVNKRSNKIFSLRAIKEHVQHLLQLFIKEDLSNLRKSGTEEQYDEKERLLQEIKDLSREFKQRGKQVKQQMLRQKGIEARDTAACSSQKVDSSAVMLDHTYDLSVEIDQNNSLNTIELIENLNKDKYEQPQASTSYKSDESETQPQRSKKNMTIKHSTLQFLKEKQHNEMQLKRHELQLQEKKLELEERKLKLEEERFNLEKREREHNMEIAKQQQSLISFFIKTYDKK